MTADKFSFSSFNKLAQVELIVSTFSERKRIMVIKKFKKFSEDIKWINLVASAHNRNWLYILQAWTPRSKH